MEGKTARSFSTGMKPPGRLVRQTPASARETGPAIARATSWTSASGSDDTTKTTCCRLRKEEICAAPPARSYPVVVGDEDGHGRLPVLENDVREPAAFEDARVSFENPQWAGAQRRSRGFRRLQGRGYWEDQGYGWFYGL